MNSTKTPYASFPIEWTIKLTSYQIRYRKTFDISEIDEVFCSIINAKGDEIEFEELGYLLGFNLQDLAETDIFNVYLKKLTEYNLITLNDKIIQLTDFGQEALQNKLKYKYFFATTDLFENQTALGESFDFSFERVFNLENRLSHEGEIIEEIMDIPEVKQILQFQLFENDIYNGEIIEIYNSKPNISYKTIALQCETYRIDNSFQLSILKSDTIKPDIQFLIDLSENEQLKKELIRKGMFHHILAKEDSISAENIAEYKDLWNWKELAENIKVCWNDQRVFKLFKENGDGSIWCAISKIAPVESIKIVIEEYAEYWNWTETTKRFDDNFIRLQFDNLNWDLEELSFKESNLVQDLLIRQREKHITYWENEITNNPLGNNVVKELATDKNYDLKKLTTEEQDELIEILTFETLRTDDWDWRYLSKNLSNDYIESHIDIFPWDYYLITEEKSEILRNLFRKQGNENYTDILLSKPWNWKFISNEFDETFLYKQLSFMAKKVEWHIILEKFFINEKLTVKCLQDESFKSLLKRHLPDNFIVAHQKYLWSLNLIDFFEELNLIQWETQSYIQGFDTNENIEWNKSIFKKYHNRITTEKGYLNVSQHITDFSLIEEFPDFGWDWQGISQNKLLVDNPIFVRKGFLGEFPFTNNLKWSEILKIITNLDFINSNLEQFHNVTNYESQVEFWEQLTQREERQFVFDNYTFPWDWSYLTENSEVETILDSLSNDELVEKWDWRIATRKLDKETILEKLENFARFMDWEFLITEIFTIENELSMDKELPRIAACLSVLDDGTRKDIWKGLTAKIPFETLFPIVQETYKVDVFEWDWNFISNNKYFPTDIATLNQFKQQINWTVFSESNAIQRKFSPNSWNSGKEWFDNTGSYLQTFEDNWDWQVLSKNDNINYNRFFLQKYRSENWDWEYLTEFGGFLSKQKRDKDNYLQQVISQFPKVQFEILSKRKDIKIGSDLILSTKNKEWDWQILSENEKAEISNELILELKDKQWNWEVLSKRKNLKFTNETLLQLLQKEWDWKYLSENKSLEFNAEFIEKTKAKTWNWKAVSRHKTFFPTIEILTLTKGFNLDWKYLSKHSSLNPTKELLDKYENQWHWESITENSQIDFSDINFIDRFADKWNWRFICESGNLPLNKNILTQFKEHLEWDLISSNTNIDFTKEIIQEFKQFWNWTALKENKRIKELLGNYIANEISKSATLNFIDKIEQQNSFWKGSIYHFSHIDNAVEIIKNMKIQSRNKARTQSDAAGNVVHLRNDAHDYARFYFRPQTPTQFYNEFLGKNTTDGYETNGYWVSRYEKARELGFPKCPIPIFFRFSLQEVLFKNENKCCVSNGNMQTRSTQFGSLDRMINKFGFEDLYYTPQEYATKEDYKRYRNYAQQEFLVKNELSFNDLSDFEIVCPTKTDKALLINLIGKEHKEVFSKIVIDSSFYNNENPRVRIDEEDSELRISTNFNGDGYFVLNGATDIKEIEILVGDVTRTSKEKIIFKSNISLGNVKQNIQLNFVDESNRNWFIFQAHKHILNSKENDILKSENENLEEFIINSEIAQKVSYKEISDILDMQGNGWANQEDNYNPSEIYKKIFNVDSPKTNIDSIKHDNINFLILTQWNNSVYEEVKKCNNLIAIYKLDISDVPNHHIKFIESKNIDIVHNGWSDWFFYASQLFYHKTLELTQKSNYQPINLITYLMKREPFSSSLNTKIRHYIIREHTLLVCNQFELYFSQIIDSTYKSFMRFMLAIHDVGKGMLAQNSNTSNQYNKNKEVIKLMIDETANCNSFDDLKLNLLNSFISHDTVGIYFQGKLPLEEVTQAIGKLTVESNIDKITFLNLMMIYYQCDIASYTEDAGGIKFLEHLFEYNNGKKIFDVDEGLLKMSPKYWEMYKRLKNEIENGN